MSQPMQVRSQLVTVYNWMRQADAQFDAYGARPHSVVPSPTWGAQFAWAAGSIANARAGYDQLMPGSRGSSALAKVQHELTNSSQLLARMSASGATFGPGTQYTLDGNLRNTAGALRDLDARYGRKQ